VLIGEDGVSGYLLAHPWRLGAPPFLDMLLGALPPDADTLYLHDIVIDPARRGRGEARAGIAALLHEAERDYASISLISIGGVTSFWKGWGFEVSRDFDVDAILRSYDSDARYMVKMLGAQAATDGRSETPR
jgi:GNAT superfamily N-acetyltransferase